MLADSSLRSSESLPKKKIKKKINGIIRLCEFIFRKFRKDFLSSVAEIPSDPIHQRHVQLKTQQDFHCNYNFRLLQTGPGIDTYKESWQAASHR